MSLFAFPSSPRRRRPTAFPSLASTWALCWLAIWTAGSSAKTASDYYIHSLPGQPDGPLLRMHAGHVEVTPEHHGNLFFWHFENRHLANRHRTVIWLNGGPGCSSMDGALMEVGPYRMKDEAHLEYNSGSWDEFANLLFVDNPVGTGFSYVDTDSYINELSTMADNMVTFLEKFFTLFPEHQNNDIYISGESYAGQHIPYIAKKILDRNAELNGRIRWNLKGLLIGNGWISPPEQSMAYLETAYKVGILEKGSVLGNQVEAQATKCKADLQEHSSQPLISYNNCEMILQIILRLSSRTQGRNGRCVNMYDTRLDDTYPDCGMNWPPDLKRLTPYLRRKDVTRALHIDSAQVPGWTECTSAVSSAFKPRKSRPAIDLLPGILSEVPVLLFSGEKDLICSHIGTEEFIHNMEWNGGKGFELSPGTWAPRRDWVFEGEPAGIYQAARNLTYVLFYNASHMVPFDYPRRTRDMLDRFMNVDIASIGGKPSDSRIDGEKGLETSVGGHPNSTAAQKATKDRLDKVKWSAYRRSGAIALVVIIILATFFGWYVWQDRRRRAGYTGLFGEGSGPPMAKGLMRRDVEAADFDENELDDLHTPPERGRGPEGERYSMGGVSSDDDGGGDGGGGPRREKRAGLKGRTNGKGA